ncbi:RNA-directed DNA polymerase, eukaryota, reverse transcriptase zinc-binding domain protein [Tanacetum coccineum]
MERGFLSKKGSGVGRGVKENNIEVTTSAGNALGKSFYANITGKPSRKKVNVHTLFTPRGNGIDVVVLMDSIRTISERFANTAYGFFLGRRWHTLLLLTMLGTLGNNPLILKKWHPDENLLKEDVGTISYFEPGCERDENIILSWLCAMPKITREGHYTCNVHVEYEWKPPRCSSCKVFGHSHEECPKNTSASEKKTVKKPSQTYRGVLVGPKIDFNPQKEYRLVPKKPIVSSSGNKKKGVEPTIEVSNSNAFDVLNSINNDVEFGTNRVTTILVNNEVTSSGSCFMNVDNSSSGNTPITDKIEKFEDLLTSGQAILVEKAGNPLKKVEFLGEYDSEDEVASVDNDMARSMTFERVRFGTQSLLEQWKDSYGNGDYDDDLYDNDMYEGQDLSHELQAICDNLDIRV